MALVSVTSRVALHAPTAHGHRPAFVVRHAPTRRREGKHTTLRARSHLLVGANKIESLLCKCPTSKQSSRQQDGPREDVVEGSRYLQELVRDVPPHIENRDPCDGTCGAEVRRCNVSVPAFLPTSQHCSTPIRSDVRAQF